MRPVLQAARRSLTALAAALLATTAQAHKPSDAYLQLEVDGTRIEQRLDIALRDLDRELVLDADDDGSITWGEVRTRWDQIAALADGALQLQPEGPSADGPAVSCHVVVPPGGARPQLDEHSDGRYAVLQRSWVCDAPVRALRVDYRLFAASDPTHRGILRVRHGGHESIAALVPGAAPRHVVIDEAAAGGAPLRGGLDFIAEGVHHILIGTDHILFLLALLLPAVLVRAARPVRHGAAGGAPGPASGSAIGNVLAMSLAYGAPAQQPAVARGLLTRATGLAAAALRTGWQPAPAFGPALWQVTKVVTAFTAAHSITLALAVLDVVNPPSRWVESLIAASVVLAALNNLVPVTDTGRWRFTFGFGLVHGFGFAAVMKDLGLADGALAVPLFTFNLGVELGQLAIVLLFVPLAWALRSQPFYARWVLRGGSALIAIAGLLWLVDRTIT
jgi:hypothetical protein